MRSARDFTFVKLFRRQSQWEYQEKSITETNSAQKTSQSPTTTTQSLQIQPTDVAQSYYAHEHAVEINTTVTLQLYKYSFITEM